VIAVAAGAAALLMVAVAVFQAALALGAPFGAYAWGGTHPGVLPPRLQLGSALSAPVILAMALIVLIRAGVIYPGWSEAMRWPAWIVFGFMVLNTFANIRSGSDKERRIMAPVTLGLALLTGYVSWMTW
jgi:hypothetical protein